MSKVSLIIRREYLSRVRKKSFIVMTILGPLLFAAIMVLPAYLATKTDEQSVVSVVDETGLYYRSMLDNSAVKFKYLDTDITEARENFNGDSTNALLYIPKTESSRTARAILFYRESQPSLSVQEHIERQMDDLLEQALIRSELNIDPMVLKKLNPDVKVEARDIESGEESLAFLTMGLSLVGGLLIYFFIFIFGSQVMRGVMEEKTSRIVEVIVSSVRPFQLMMGKIIGVALVGLTQFLLWILLTFIIVAAVRYASPELLDPAGAQQKVISDSGTLMPQGADSSTKTDAFEKEEGFAAVAQGLINVNWPLVLGSFLLYFLFGYLLYAALFAAIGSAVDNEADTQQFMLPITVPLILAIIMSSFITQNPNGPVAFWLSIIPFTSPVVMMIRIPFDVPMWELILSLGLLVLTFIGSVWLAGKIYRTGILMYGKKVNYRELWKWIRYSN